MPCLIEDKFAAYPDISSHIEVIRSSKMQSSRFCISPLLVRRVFKQLLKPRRCSVIKRLRWVIVPLMTLLSACQATHMASDGTPMSLVASRAFDDDKSLFSALVHQESGGRSHVVSHAGAVGKAQLMLPTARIMARKLGMRKVAKLPKRKLKRLLMRNPSLNEKLGRAYLNEGRNRYGRDDIALIYYNGGPRAANAAYKSLKKSGRMNIYTGETYCYVKSITRMAGIVPAPMKLIKGKAYYRNRSKWIRRTGRAPCKA